MQKDASVAETSLNCSVAGQPREFFGQARRRPHGRSRVDIHATPLSIKPDDAFNQVSSAKAVGQILLIPEAVTALEKLRDDWAAVIDAGEPRGGLVRVAETAVVKLRDVARRDLVEGGS